MSIAVLASGSNSAFSSTFVNVPYSFNLIKFYLVVTFYTLFNVYITIQFLFMNPFTANVLVLDLLYILQPSYSQLTSSNYIT